MEEATTYKLGDISTMKYGKLPPKHINEGNYPIWSGYRYVGKCNEFNCNKGDIIIVARGVGGTGDVKIAKEDCYLTNLSIQVKLDKNLCQPEYFYYSYLLSNLKYLDSGSAQSQITIEDLKRLEVTLPPLEQQHKITDILKSIDEKIELNRQINDNLEQQAQALYKSWFIDFEPFKDGEFVESEIGLIPEGWKVGTLSDLAEITMGQSPSGKSYNECGEGILFYQGRAEFGDRYPSIRLYTTEPSRIAEQNSVLLSVRAPVGDTNIAYNKCCIGRGLASIKAKHGFNSFIFYMIKSMRDQFDMYNGEGTVFGSINRDSLNSLNVIVPTNVVINEFEKIVAPLDLKYKSLFAENLLLTQQRDALLPKLMSGELKINEIDC
jgi:type I restriction enzyme S subunit